METFTKDNGTKVNETDMEYLRKEMVIILKDTGLMTKEKVRAHTFTATRTNFLLVNGLMTNQKQECTPRSKMKMPTLDQKGHISKIHMFCHKFQN